MKFDAMMGLDTIEEMVECYEQGEKTQEDTEKLLEGIKKTIQEVRDDPDR
jgi:hypothetical protein